MRGVLKSKYVKQKNIVYYFFFFFALFVQSIKNVVLLPKIDSHKSVYNCVNLQVCYNNRVNLY